MEDILASIRRILSEDEPQPAAPPPGSGGAAQSGAAQSGAARSAGESDVLVLDSSMEVSEPEPIPDEVIVPPGPPPVAVERERPAPAPTPAKPDPVLVAPEIAAAAASAVGGLLRKLASERSTRVYSSGPTIEDLVREEMRPLLKAWLDTHLPEMVERLVHAEIERVVRRAVP